MRGSAAGLVRQRLSSPLLRRQAPAPDSHEQHTGQQLLDSDTQGAGARAPRNVIPSSVCSALMNTCMMTCSGACAAGNWPGSWKWRTMPGACGGAGRCSAERSDTGRWQDVSGTGQCVRQEVFSGTSFAAGCAGLRPPQLVLNRRRRCTWDTLRGAPRFPLSPCLREDRSSARERRFGPRPSALAAACRGVLLQRGVAHPDAGAQGAPPLQSALGWRRRASMLLRHAESWQGHWRT